MRLQRLLELLAEKVEEFYTDHSVYPNAILLSIEDIGLLGGMQDKKQLKTMFPTIETLIPVPDRKAVFIYDLPLPMLLPRVATRKRRKGIISLEHKDF